MTTKQHIDDFRAKVTTRAFNAARALIERDMTGAIAEAATKELDRARDAWIPLQSAQDNEPKWKAWLADERQKNHPVLDALVGGDAGGTAYTDVVDANGWSPIDTAPTDDTLDLWHPQSGRHADCRWVKDPDEELNGWWEQQYAEADSWVTMGEEWKPTHWRRRPADPVQA